LGDESQNILEDQSAIEIPNLRLHKNKKQRPTTMGGNLMARENLRKGGAKISRHHANNSVTITPKETIEAQSVLNGWLKSSLE
jgi:hypothetical protein